MEDFMKNVYISDHPLVVHKVTHLCDVTTGYKEFNEITNVETKLFEAFKDQYGKHSLEDFGSSSYQGSLSSIMFDYWRSYLSVKYLVEERANNDVKQVFDTYHKWDREGRKVPLTQYFELSPLFD